MSKHEMITVPDNKKASTKASRDFDPSSPNFYVPHLSKALGNRALSREIHIDHKSLINEDGLIDGALGVAREASVESEVVINPQTDLGKIPGTEEYKKRQEAIANFAYSELAASNAHVRN